MENQINAGDFWTHYKGELTSQGEITSLFTLWFNQNLRSLTVKEDKFLLNQSPMKMVMYQDRDINNVIIATVYFDILEKKYLVESSGDWKFTVGNIVEVFDCINDISKEYAVYGKCWDLYDKFRKAIDPIEYKKYSIYLDNNFKHTDWIINILRREWKQNISVPLTNGSFENI